MTNSPLYNAVHFPVDAKHQLEEVRRAVEDLTYEELLEEADNIKVRRYVDLAYKCVDLSSPLEGVM